MTIQDMHNLFRTLGQQMGLQLVRGILPESIDNYLNTAIIETVRQIVMSNVQTVYQDKITTRTNPISELNSIHTLFRHAESSDIVDYKIKFTDSIDDIMYYTSFDVKYDDDSVYRARLIETDRLYYVLNDYCNRASREYPVIAYLGNDEFAVYTDNNVPHSIAVNYVKLPVKVSHNDSIDCDLPEHLHHQVVETAVNKFFQSVGSTSNNVS